MLAARPLRIYNTGDKHWRQYSPGTSRRPVILKAASNTKDDEIEKLKLELRKHREAERKIKMHVKWILRSTQATHKDAKDISQIVKELYGDDDVVESP